MENLKVGNPAAVWGGFAAQSSTAPLALVGGAYAPAAMTGRIALGAATGAGSQLLAQVDAPAGQYWSEKVKQVTYGGMWGIGGGAVAEAAPYVLRAARPLYDPIVARVGGFKNAVSSVWRDTIAANSGIDAIVGAGRKEGRSLFNPTSGKINCVDGVCAFLNTIKTKELHTAIPDSQVSSNGGRIHVALDEIAEKTGVYFGKRNFQFNTLETARERQFFVIFDGASSVDSSHVAIGIVNRGNRTIFDPQSGETFKDFSKFGSGRFVSYPLLLDAPIPKKLGN